MRPLLAALITALCATVVSAPGAQADDHYPVGDFRVAPTSGPIGTTVTVSGSFDREITRVRFTCVYHDTFVDAFDVAHTPPEPSPTFTFEYEIPAQLSVRQPRPNVPTRPPLGDDCFFLAEAGHRLARASVQFTVTEAAVALPSTGLTSRSHGATIASTAVAILAANGIVLVLLGWWYNKRQGQVL